MTWSIVDDGWPDLRELVAVTTVIHHRLAQGTHVLVRCMAGLNRSGLMCAGVLVRHGSTPQDAIDTVRAARSRHALCNPQFVELLTSMEPGDATLGLGISPQNVQRRATSAAQSTDDSTSLSIPPEH